MEIPSPDLFIWESTIGTAERLELARREQDISQCPLTPPMLTSRTTRYGKMYMAAPDSTARSSTVL